MALRLCLVGWKNKRMEEIERKETKIFQISYAETAEAYSAVNALVFDNEIGIMKIVLEGDAQ